MAARRWSGLSDKGALKKLKNFDDGKIEKDKFKGSIYKLDNGKAESDSIAYYSVGKMHYTFADAINSYVEKCRDEYKKRSWPENVKGILDKQFGKAYKLLEGKKDEKASSATGVTVTEIVLEIETH